MIIEIHYYGKVIKEIELPDSTEIERLSFSARLQSRMNQDESDGLRYYFQKPKSIHAKPKMKDKPRVSIPQKEDVKFERPKAVYSNPRPYDF